MLGKKRFNLTKKKVSVIVIVLIILLLIIFSFTLKEDRKLSPAGAFIKDTLVHAEKIITYPFKYITKELGEYRKLKNVNEEKRRGAN